jgi:vancomycin permeability regulator SanA
VTPRPEKERLLVWHVLARGLALFLGGFTLLNVVGSVRSAGFDANLWWIDLRLLPREIADPILLVSAACLVAFAIWPPISAWRRWLTFVCLVALGIMALINTVQFYGLVARHAVHAGIPIPLSVLIAASVGLAATVCARPPPQRVPSRSLIPVLVVCLACVVCFPVAQMLCFGKTDYRRPADAVVVLGARVYADGRPSDALADRVRTACQLYRDGLASKLILSGGPGDGAIHETESMRRLALQLGVKADDIWLDQAGLNTQATVRNTEAVLARWQASRILVVSHFYHLPRIKLAYQRDGWDVYTVPAKESYLLRQMPYNMAREVAALWVYYLRPLARA